MKISRIICFIVIMLCLVSGYAGELEGNMPLDHKHHLVGYLAIVITVIAYVIPESVLLSM